MNKFNVIQRLQKLKGSRTQKEFADSLHITQQYLSDVLKGRRDPGPRILKALGLRKGYEMEDHNGNGQR